jgi:hypothetical protein
MRIKKKNVARLASISTLGAGVLGSGALSVGVLGVGALSAGVGTAEAGIIHQTLSATVGFSAGIGLLSPYRVSPRGFPNVKFTFSAASWVNPKISASGHSVKVRASAQAGWFAWLKPPVSNSGVTWNEAPGKPSKSVVLVSTTQGPRCYYGCSHGTGTVYDLFTFGKTGAATQYYGWFNLDNYNDGGPFVRIEELSYEGAGTPEPSTGVLSLAALVLGAAGVRRWRAARKQAA